MRIHRKAATMLQRKGIPASTIHAIITDGSWEGPCHGSTIRHAVAGNVGSGGGVPELIDGLLSRLETFVHPFTACLREPEQHRHTVEYVTGLLSKLEHKTGEGIAYLHDQERQGIQKFIGQSVGPCAPADRAGPAGRRDLGERTA